MNWKLFRLRKRWLFQTVIQKGKVFIGESYLLKSLSVNYPFFNKKRVEKKNCLFGIGISKKIFKRATERNYCKRIIREIIIEQLKEFQWCALAEKNHTHQFSVVVIRKSYIKKNFLEKKKELKSLLISNYNKSKIK